MLSLSDKEVKESVNKNEEKLTLRFNICLILLNNIEDVVTTTTKTWKKIYYLHKSSDFLVQVEENEEEEEEEEKEEEIQIDNHDQEEEEQDVTKEGLHKVQIIEDSDLKKIVVEVITSFSYSPRKLVTTSSSKKTSTELILSSFPNTSIQSI